MNKSIKYNVGDKVNIGGTVRSLSQTMDGRVKYTIELDDGEIVYDVCQEYLKDIDMIEEDLDFVITDPKTGDILCWLADPESLDKLIFVLQGMTK